jgi:hypothetical protein
MRFISFSFVSNVDFVVALLDIRLLLLGSLFFSKVMQAAQIPRESWSKFVCNGIKNAA